MRHFVFCHGFGLNHHFWDNLAPYFSQEKCSFIDLGYFRNPSPPLALPEQKIVGIGHSLGLLKLMALHHNFECLIGLNGFTHFLGHKPDLRRRRQIELSALTQHFSKNPMSTLKTFYERCGIPSFINQGHLSDLDLHLMLTDLQLLKESNHLPTFPTLILASKEDVVVPKSITEDNFAGYPHIEVDIFDEGKHNLGFVKARDVYERIMRFLDSDFKGS